MPGADDALAVVSGLPSAIDSVTAGEFETSESVAGDRSTIASREFDGLVAVRDGDTYDLDLVAYESFASDNTSGDTDTLNLNHNPIETASTAQDVVLWAGADRVAASDYSVDYANDTVAYSGPETVDDLHVFYVSGEQAHVEIRKVAPNGTFETLDEANLNLLNLRNKNKTPLRFDFDHPLQGVIPANWRLEIVVDGPYVISWGVDTDGDNQPDAIPSNQLLTVPVGIAREQPPGWVEEVIASIAGQR